MPNRFGIRIGNNRLVIGVFPIDTEGETAMPTPQTPAVLTSQDRSGNSFRVVAMTLASLVPDGQRLGAQIADIAIAALGGSRPPALTLDFLLDGRQFPVQ